MSDEPHRDPSGAQLRVARAPDVNRRRFLMFGAGAASIRGARRNFVFRYASPAHWIDVFRTYYGPVQKAFGALDTDGQAALEAELTDLLRSLDVSAGASLVIPSEYLEVVITKR